MFYDLNIRRPKTVNEDSLLKDTVKQAAEFGYRGVAITTLVEDLTVGKTKKGKEKHVKKAADVEEKDIIPVPYHTEELQEKFSQIRFYSRIDVVIANTNDIRRVLQSKNIKKYDIIAFQPENQVVCKALSNINDIDIISYNPESRCTLSFNRKLYNQFVSHNVYFEIAYTPAIIDTTARRNLLSLSHIYHAVGKSKNIIVTSGAKVSSHLRGPYDVINFSLLFGLSEEQAKSAISRNCEKLLLKARRQRRGKSTIEMKVKNPLKAPAATSEIQMSNDEV